MDAILAINYAATAVTSTTESSEVLGISNVYLQMLILVVSILGVAFFSSSEAALLSVNKVRIRHLSEEGNRKAQAVERVMNQHEKFFATILLTENTFIIFASTVGTAMAISLLGGTGMALLLATFVLTVAIVQLGEITPKTLAARSAERWSLLAGRLIETIMWLETFVIYLFTLMPRFLFKLMGGARGSWTPSVTEGELRMLIDVAETEGVMERAEAQMLEKVFHFGDRQVHEIMTPRTEIVWMEKGTTFQDFLQGYSQQTHTRFPVFEGDQENVVGCLSVKDLLEAMAQGKLQPADNVTDVLRPVHFVPETKPVGQLFEELREKGTQMAMVVDYHGGIAGLATLKSLLEVIVGPVGEEGEPVDVDFVPLGENHYDVDAGISIQEANERLGMKLPYGDYQTLAGFILKRLGRIPEVGDHFYYNDARIEVKEMRRVKIERVEVRWERQPAENITS